MFIADVSNHEVRKISVNGVISRVAGTGVQGSTGDGGSATSATLNSPQGVTVDSAGNLYVADTGNHKIRLVSALTGNITTLAGTGSAAYSGDLGQATAAGLSAPSGVFWSTSGVLYVADTGNSVIRTIGLQSGKIQTFAGNGNAGSNGDGGSAAVAQLQRPQGVAVDSAGNVYIADSGNNRIRVVNASGIISTVAGQQGGGFNGDGPAVNAELNGPSGVSVDSSGAVYVADTANNRIRVIYGGQIITVAGSGAAASTGDGASSAVAALNNPSGVVLDSVGNVYIADTANNEIRKINVGANALVYPTTNPGDTTAPQVVSLFDSGNQPLTLNTVSVPNGYVDLPNSSAVDCGTAPITLAPATSCSLNLAFHPATVGAYPGNVVLTDSAEGLAVTQHISLSGASDYVFTPSVALPSSTVSGSSITVVITVTNPKGQYFGTLHFTSTDSQATLPADYTFLSGDNGTHSLTVLLRTAGSQCITVTDPKDSTITATSCTAVAAGPPTSATVSSGDSQSTNVSTTYASRLVVLITDAAGNPVPSAKVTFTAPAAGSGAYGTFATSSGAQSSDVETTDLSGFASAANLVSGPNIGTFQVNASVTGGTTSATFNMAIVILGGFTITPSSPQVGPIVPTISSTQTLSITPTGGFSAPIQMSCTAPSGITCTITPATVSFANGKPVNLPELSIQGQGALRSPVGAGFQSSGPFLLLLLVLSAGNLLKRRTVAGLILGLAVCSVMTCVVGCSGTNYPTTTNGTFTITVTGTAQTVSASTTVSYVVQQ